MSCEGDLVVPLLSWASWVFRAAQGSVCQLDWETVPTLQQSQVSNALDVG